MMPKVGKHIGLVVMNRETGDRELSPSYVISRALRNLSACVLNGTGVSLENGA